MAGIFVLILLFGLLRPAIRNLLAKGTDEQDESAEDAALANLDVDEYLIADDRVSLNSIDDFSLMGPSESFERQLEVLRGLIAEDPARVALVLQQWITSDD